MGNPIYDTDEYRASKLNSITERKVTRLVRRSTVSQPQALIILISNILDESGGENTQITKFKLPSPLVGRALEDRSFRFNIATDFFIVHGLRKRWECFSTDEDVPTVLLASGDTLHLVGKVALDWRQLDDLRLPRNGNQISSLTPEDCLQTFYVIKRYLPEGLDVVIGSETLRKWEKMAMNGS